MSPPISLESMSIMTEEKSRDYLCLRRPNFDDTFITHSDRTDIVDWMYNIVDACDFDLGMVAMAMGLVDRFLSKPSSIARGALQDRKQFQLVAVAALSLCINNDETVVPGSGLLAVVSSKVYSPDEIKDMESSILDGLSSGINAPTSIQIARHFLALALPGVDIEASMWGCLLDDVRFQLEYAVRDYYFIMQWPRTLAMAAILNAMDEVTGQNRRVMLRLLPSLVRKHFPSFGDLVATKKRLQTVTGRADFSDDATDVLQTSVESLEESLAAGKLSIGQKEAPSYLERVDLLVDLPHL